ncbi:hypothetical protein PIB30_102914 [Stylosanthes scabra]|uniref:Uncharacterized protein n=1 Tax=Stylosanthes scabra TaxID=79078 RepID=A0ABU6SYJ4_9FABA|nr:hypothetical protein [Stylosanthes scabra]
MPRAKQTTKRTRNEDIVHIEPPSDHPLFQYFSRLDDLNNYIFNFSERKEISPSGTLSTIWGFDDLDTSNCVLFDGNKTPENWGPHVKRQAFEMFNIQRVYKKKILCNVFNLEMRLLHYLITYVLFPRSTGSPRVIIQRVLVMFAYGQGFLNILGLILVMKVVVCWLNNMSLTQGHLTIWVEIYKGEEQQPPPPPQEQAPQEQPGPSEQPSMRDMMQVLLRIEQNQANMDTHLTRVDQRLSRIEQYLEIDEDKDQD